MALVAPQGYRQLATEAFLAFDDTSGGLRAESDEAYPC